MAIQDDFTIDYGAKTVEHTSGATVYTVLAFFQWLAATFASSPQMDDDYAFVSDTPTVYRWVNSWAFGVLVTDYKFLSGGGITSSDADDAWSNLYSIGTQESGTQIALFQDDDEVTPWWGTDNIDILVYVKQGGVWIQSDNVSGTPTDGGVWVYAREYGDLYDHNYVDLVDGGRNPVGVNTSPDSGNTSAIADASSWAADLSIGFGYITRNLNNGAGLQPYDAEIDCSAHTMAEVYEALKYLTRYGETGLINADAGQEYRSASEGDYADVKVAPFGTLAGTTLYGARGIWFSNYDAADFVLKDALNVIQSPPNYQKVTASHDSLANCNVFVSEVSGGIVLKEKYIIDTSSATHIATTAVLLINETPVTGSFRIGEVRFVYTGFDGSAFTGVTPDPTGEGGTLYVPLLDGSTGGTSLQSDNVIYSYNIAVRTAVRKYGFKPYTADTTFQSTGLSFSPILTTDPQAT